MKKSTVLILGLLAVALALVLAGCTGPTVPLIIRSGPGDGSSIDGGAVDEGSVDGGDVIEDEGGAVDEDSVEGEDVIGDEGGDGSDAAHPKTKVIPAQNISETWSAINSEVLAAQEYVILDLSACTVNSNTIGSSAFSGLKDNPYIKGIILPSSLLTIGNNAFFQCTNLTAITIHEGVTRIEENAFQRCTNLTAITIPASVTFIHNRAFENCTSLASITVNGNNSDYSSQDGVLFSKDKTTLVRYPNGKNGSYTIPASVITIRADAFYACTNLTAITIPASVAFIYNDFYGCYSLTSITVHSNNLDFSSQDGVLFNKNKTSLIRYPKRKSGSTYTIPEGVTIIMLNAFSSCTNLTAITIPASVQTIGQAAFTSCTNLTSVTFEVGSNISASNFSSSSPFPGDLRTKYLAGGGGAGTYTTTAPVVVSSVWAKQ